MNLAAVAAPVRARVKKARASFPPLDVAIRTFARYSDDDGGTHSAAITYYIFFSIFPLLLASAAVLGYLTFADEELKRELLDSGLGSIPLLKDVISTESLSVLGENRGFVALGAVFLGLYTGAGAVRGLKHALDHMDRNLEETTFLGKLYRPLMWLGFLAAAAVGSVALSFASSVLDLPFAYVVSTLAALATGTALFAGAFKLLPAKKRSWSEVLPGAIVGAVAFELIKFGGGWYLTSTSGGRHQQFGPFAAAATLLVVCNLTARVVVLSAEVNHAVAERRSTRQAG